LDIHGKHLAVVFEVADEETPQIYVVTAFEGAPAFRTQATEKKTMNPKNRKTIQWSPEQRAHHKAIRDAFRDWRPGPEELIASGAAARLGLAVVHAPARELLQKLKAAREAAGLTLADVSNRCGIDQPALSRLENGHTANPTLDTLWRYAAAVGKRLTLLAEDIPVTQSVPATSGRSLPKKAPARKNKTA
jgi:DNA-binding XRE family transcriptional regulator